MSVQPYGVLLTVQCPNEEAVARTIEKLAAVAAGLVLEGYGVTIQSSRLDTPKAP